MFAMKTIEIDEGLAGIIRVRQDIVDDPEFFSCYPLNSELEEKFKTVNELIAATVSNIFFREQGSNNEKV